MVERGKQMSRDACKFDAQREEEIREIERRMTDAVVRVWRNEATRHYDERMIDLCDTALYVAPHPDRYAARLHVARWIWDAMSERLVRSKDRRAELAKFAKLADPRHTL